MMIALSGRMSCSHGYFKEQIIKHGGKINNSVLGVTCVVASPGERNQGGSGGFAEPLERGTPVVSENWILDSIEKKEVQPLAAYDIVADVVLEGRGLPLGQLDPGEEAIETLAAEVKLAGKRAVHKDSKLDKEGGSILERDGIVYNCAFAVCDLGREMNQSSNLLKHLHKGFLPAVCHFPVPGYMAIVCSDAAAEAACYGFTAVDRPEGYLVLAVASLGKEITEVTGTPGAEDMKGFEGKKMGVKGLGRKTTTESDHITWRDGVKVPCGKLVPSRKKGGPLEYNEYVVYDPKQVSICFLVGVKYEEQNMEVVDEE